MAFRINGVIRIADNGDANLGLVTATNVDVGVGSVTAGELYGKVSKEAITNQTDGDESNITGADELLIYDKQTDSLLRISVDEFIIGSGIGTIVSEFDDITVSGILSAAKLTSDTFVSIGASLIPDANISYDLGSSTNRFRDLYLDGNTVYLGVSSISATGDSLKFNGASVLIADNVEGDLSIEGSLTVGTGASVTTEKIYTETLSAVGSSITVNKSLVPAEDTTYDLGSVDKQWKDLYLSGNTLYVGGVPISNQSGPFSMMATIS